MPGSARAEPIGAWRWCPRSNHAGAQEAGRRRGGGSWGASPSGAARSSMSSERGNVARTRPQRHQNAHGFRNNRHDSSARRKTINAKIHEGLCQHCKEVLEWRVKFNKYKPLTQPKKCVKCLKKTVKDSYHIICKLCAHELELCAKCGKKEEIVIPIQTSPENTEHEPSKNDQTRNRNVEFEESHELELSDREDEDVDFLVMKVTDLKPERMGV